jgi:hypothetical protein
MQPRGYLKFKEQVKMMKIKSNELTLLSISSTSVRISSEYSWLIFSYSPCTMSEASFSGFCDDQLEN